MPVVATGLAGGRTGTRIVEELTEEAILNDFVRIRDESRTSTAVVDPDRRDLYGDQRMGPQGLGGRARDPARQAPLPLAGASTVVFAGSLPRGVDEGFYAEAVREMTRLGAHVVLDAEGEPLKRGIEAEPWLVSPNQHEAEQLVGQELEDDDDFVMALDRIAEMGARNVHITMETGCFALVREERQVRRYRARAPQVEPVSIVGAGDVLLAQWIVAQGEGLPAEESLRRAVAAGSASVLEVGAGRFDRKEAARLDAARRGRRAAARRVSQPGRRLRVSGRPVSLTASSRTARVN